MSTYEVAFVADEALPAEQDWVVAEVEGDFYALVKRSRVCPSVLTEAWEGYRHLARVPVPRGRGLVDRYAS